RRERQVKDASRAKRRRNEETDDEQRERQVKNAFHQHQHHHRQRSSSLYVAALRDEFPAESYYGTMDSPCMTLLTGTNEIIYGLWNTTAGGSSSLSIPGNSIGTYNPTQTPQHVFDQNNITKYTSYGICNQSAIYSSRCGANTGLYLTLQRGGSLLTGIRFYTANGLPERDPMTITVEGSNQPSSALLLGSSWTLMYNGSSGLNSDPGRYRLGVTETISNNVVYYKSYRLLITSIRNISNAAHYSEVELLGY
ncbi:unnamed protein product, partial [Rotaria sordida]